MKNYKTSLATRIHRTSGSKLVSFDKIIEFVNNGKKYSDIVIICVDIRETFEDKQYFESILNCFVSDQSVIVIPISTWGRFTLSLNIAIQKALENGCKYIIFQSLEFMISTNFMSIIFEQIEQPNILVVGPAIEGHEFEVGLQKMRGRTCPWNTMAIWNLELLGLTGFHIISDGIGGNWGGVEEVVAISLHQIIRPYLKAILIKRIGNQSNTTQNNDGSQGFDIKWETNFEGDELRRSYHIRKMESKDERANIQIEKFGIPFGVVHHVEVE